MGINKNTPSYRLKRKNLQKQLQIAIIQLKYFIVEYMTIHSQFSNSTKTIKQLVIEMAQQTMQMYQLNNIVITQKSKPHILQPTNIINYNRSQPLTLSLYQSQTIIYILQLYSRKKLFVFIVFYPHKNSRLQSLFKLPHQQLVLLRIILNNDTKHTTQQVAQNTFRCNSFNKLNLNITVTCTTNFTRFSTTEMYSTLVAIEYQNQNKMINHKNIWLQQRHIQPHQSKSVQQEKTVKNFSQIKLKMNFQTIDISRNRWYTRSHTRIFTLLYMLILQVYISLRQPFQQHNRIYIITSYIQVHRQFLFWY
eukprot:TRINITY_DN5995_c0_g1_i2.p1 TRINITY_DN5995_c0_g1~~TRINITY_DN5995_c0_g1_i2.p1  ORF type:complete len:307 (+),score=-33.31 TRINITY_DN5995_c0_g1_i2:783-1703(+)